MALSAPSTPRSNFATFRRLGTRTPGPPETPDCYSKVTVETPLATRARSSKDKYDELRNLTVAVRVRPMNSKELACVGAKRAVKVKDQDLVVCAGSGSTYIEHIFQYDHIFWSVDEDSSLFANQDDVFLTLGEPLLNYAFSGYNACLFAYGQTGSGKSYSMMGPDVDSFEHSGITPRFCKQLFSRIARLDPGTSVSVDVSYFEIYNEKIHDLLATSANRTPLKVREHPEWGPYVVDLSVHSVKTYEELREWLMLGNKNRATAATAMNEKSSRSHSIFSIELCLSEGLNDTDTDSRRSKVSLIDLAGSERLGSSHNSEEKIRQGVSINKSLLTLGKVISALAEQKKNNFVPYRESVLTWLLKESLGGNSLTSMLATITPANTHVEETLATLRYACQARSIVNRARINENPHDRLIRELRAEVQRLRALRKDYERNSSSSVIQLDDLSNESRELEELREKLSQTESQLLDAQLSWEQRFMEVKRNQLEELAAVEKKKKELESHVRVLETLDVNITLSPLKTNFLEAVDDVLSNTTPLENKESTCDVDHFKKLSSKAGLDLDFIFNENCTVTVVDNKLNKQTTSEWKDLEIVDSAKEFRLFYDKMIWSDCKPKRINRSDVVTSMNQIYKALTTLQPIINEAENLQLLFAKLNKNLQSFETALLNTVNKTNGTQKSVTFNV